MTFKWFEGRIKTKYIFRYWYNSAWSIYCNDYIPFYELVDIWDTKQRKWEPFKRP